ncbi:MAG: T9SS type A sorting domain-containing protein [Nonlabens sp.]
MKQITLLAVILLSALGYSQNFPLDFENGTTVPAYQFDGVVFNNVANPDMVNNMSTRVLQLDKGSTTNNGAGAAWFAGVGFDNPNGVLIDLSNGTTFTMKVWSSRANVPFRTRLQISPNSAPAYNFDFTVPVANVWTDIVLDFAAANPGINGTEQYSQFVIQPDFDPSCAASGCPPISVDSTYFIDDIVQVDNRTPATDPTLSDLTVDGTTVEDFAPNTVTYNVDLPTGTTTVPTVAGTANQPGATVTVTQAASVNDDATVTVTALDGTTTRTYTVSFMELAPAIPVAPQIQSDGANLFVYSDLGDMTNTVSNFNFLAFSNNGADYQQVDLDNDGNVETGSATNLNFYGAEWAAVDLTQPLVSGDNSTIPQFVHLSYYATTSTEITFFPIDQEAGAICCGNPNEPRYTIATAGGDALLVQGSWQSIFIPLSEFDNFNATADPIYDLENIFQYKFTGNGNFFFDNIFFSSTNTLSNTSLSLQNLSLSPNPSNGIWNVNGAQNNIDSIQVFDLLGKQVLDLTPNARNYSIDGTELQSGIYLARITSGTDVQTLKIVRR